MSLRAHGTVREALDRFRQANGLRGDDVSRASWACRLGPMTLRLPNFQWRRDAILAHDLHHVFTGYPCTMRGEFQMASWEFGAGRMPHWAATAFCLPLVLLGLVWSPRRTLLAFLGGRRSRSLHGMTSTDPLLDAPFDSVRSAFVVATTVNAPWSDRARFAFLVTQASLLASAPIALVGGVLTVIGAA